MSKWYRNPPIIDARCEFQFDTPDTGWDLTIPTVLYAKLQETFPQLRLVEPRKFSSREAAATPLMELLHKDERITARLGKHFLSITHKKPYSSWKNFLNLVDTVFNAYREVANPGTIRGITVRYINQFNILGLEDGIRLDEYFELFPYVGKGMHKNFGAFILGIQVPYPELNHRDLLVYELTNYIDEKTVENNVCVIVLDLYYTLMKPGEVPFEKVHEWLDNAHRELVEAFEECITEKLRQTFEEVTE